MGENQLTGTILSTLGLLHPTLDRLELQSNLLTGSIPEELGLLTLMSDLRLDANNLTGTILSEFTQFTESKFLYFNNNSLTGTIPALWKFDKAQGLSSWLQHAHWYHSKLD